MEAPIRSILKQYPPHNRRNLIPILQAVQKEEGYISPNAVKEISAHLSVPPNQIFGVATFYRSLSLTPKGKCTMSVCMGTACHVRNASRITEELERLMGVKAGQTTPDMNFTLETVNCLGACALGPIVVVNGKYHGQMDITKTRELYQAMENRIEEEVS